MPMHRHYKEADTFVKRYQVFRDSTLADVHEDIRDDVERDLWDIITHFGFETRMLNALPEHHDQIDEVMDMGGTKWRNYKRSICEQYPRS